jgi:hypothetical protein
LSDRLRISPGNAISSRSPPGISRRIDAWTALRATPSASQRPPLVAVRSPVRPFDRDRALLACVVAPDARDGEAHNRSGNRQCDDLPRRVAIEVDDCLVHPDRRRLAGRGDDRRTDDRQVARRIGGIDDARLQHDPGPRGIEQELLLAQELGAPHARQRRDPRLELRRQVGGVAAARCAEVDIGGQDALEPRIERIAERGDHDDHGDRQPDAGDDRREAHRNLTGRAAQLSERQPRSGRAGHGQLRERQRREARHQQQRADQQQRDRRVPEERQPGHRRQHRGHGAD